MADLGGRAFGPVLSGDSDPSPPSSPTSRCRAPSWPPSPAEDGAARRRPQAGRLTRKSQIRQSGQGTTTRTSPVPDIVDRSVPGHDPTDDHPAARGREPGKSDPRLVRPAGEIVRRCAPHRRGSGDRLGRRGDEWRGEGLGGGRRRRGPLTPRARLARAGLPDGRRRPRGGVAVPQTFRPDVVVLEMLGEAGVTGDDLARGIRAQSDPLLVFVSRDHRLESRLLAFEAGADDYVTKPYQLEELLARLQAVLQRSGRHGEHGEPRRPADRGRAGPPGGVRWDDN